MPKIIIKLKPSAETGGSVYGPQLPAHLAMRATTTSSEETPVAKKLDKSQKLVAQLLLLLDAKKLKKKLKRFSLKKLKRLRQSVDAIDAENEVTLKQRLKKLLIKEKKRKLRAAKGVTNKSAESLG